MTMSALTRFTRRMRSLDLSIVEWNKKKLEKKRKWVASGHWWHNGIYRLSNNQQIPNRMTLISISKINRTKQWPMTENYAHLSNFLRMTVSFININGDMISSVVFYCDTSINQAIAAILMKLLNKMITSIQWFHLDYKSWVIFNLVVSAIWRSTLKYDFELKSIRIIGFGTSILLIFQITYDHSEKGHTASNFWF